MYETESGLYYLQSRYYDPKIGRFINADSFVSTGQGIIGNNMFAYCNNNPITFTDNDGLFPVAFPIAFEDAEEDDIDYTATVGFSFGFSFCGFFGFNGQIGVSTDAQGNSELQGSFSGGFTPDNVNPASAPKNYQSLQGSLMGFITFTNAPSVGKLTGPGYQVGGTFPVCGPVAVGYDYNILEDTANNSVYHGVTYSYGWSTPGPHVAWGQTQTIMEVDFNLFEFFADVQKRRMEMGYT